MKHFLAAALALSVAAAGIPGAAAEPETAAAEPAEIIVTLNGEALAFGAFRPELDGGSGRVFLPLRQTFEALGCDSGDILWDGETQTATASRWGVTVSLTVGAAEARVTENGETRSEAMDAAPYIKLDENGGGYVYIPLRFAAQALGCGVDWDGETRTVRITDDFLAAEDAGGFISFANLGQRVRSGNLTALYLEETIAAVEALDYEKMQEALLQQINQIADAQWYATVALGQDSYTAATLQQTYNGLNTTFEDLRDGKIQKDNADIVRQLRNAQDQLVFGAESLYVGAVELLRQRETLERGLATLDRALEEMELRYSLGQISALSLEQLRGSRADLLSKQESLNMAVSLYKLQLEQFTGAELTGEIALNALPAVPEIALDAMDLEADLAAAKEASYELYAAKLSYEDAEDEWKKNWAGREFIGYRYEQAEHTWKAAQYTYDNAVRDYELRFRTLYLQVKDYAQQLSAARAALDLARLEYGAAAAKYNLGNLSRNALADADDEVSTARDAADTAARNLFSSYNNYRWAVQYGILN